MSEKQAHDIGDLIRKWRFTAICESCDDSHDLEPDDIFVGTMAQAAKEAQRRAAPLDDAGHVLARVDYESMGVIDMVQPPPPCPGCEAAARELTALRERMEELCDYYDNMTGAADEKPLVMGDLVDDLRALLTETEV